jgi:hypothetical protein
MSEQEKKTTNLPTNSDSMASTALTPMTPIDDGGFSACDEAEDFSPSLIIGTKVKFGNDAKWYAGDEVIPPDRQFVVIEIARAVQKWVPGVRRPESRILGHDEKFPNVVRLNNAEPREMWREAFGQLRGPFENVFLIYLCDPATYQGFTIPFATTGGHLASKELKDCCRRAQLMQGPHIRALVTLGHVWMPTGYGGRERAHFNILKYILFGPKKPDPALAATPTPQLAGGSEVKPPTEAKPVEAVAPTPKAKPTVTDVLNTFADAKDSKKQPATATDDDLNDALPDFC